MTEKDQQTRKQWLFAFIAYFAISLINTAKQIMVISDNFEGNILLAMVVTSLALPALFAYALYRFAYKKPGTKFLTGLLIFVPVSTVGTFYFANQAGVPLLRGIWEWVGYLATLALYIMNWKMLRVNKSLKAS